MIACIFQLLNLVPVSLPLDFGTKTPYEPPKGVAFEEKDSICNCTAIQVNGILRHGSRYPSRRDIKSLRLLTRKLTSWLPVLDAHWSARMSTWNFPSTLDEHREKHLHNRGEEEQYNLGRRIATSLPKLFSINPISKDYEFVSTDEERTLRSASAFGLGLFEGRGTLGSTRVEPIAVRSRDVNRMLRFFDDCPLYIQAVSKNRSALVEEMFHWEGSLMKKVAKRLSVQLTGGRNQSLLSVDDVRLFSRACILETNECGSSPMCQLFSDDDWRIVNYALELKNFWKRSYGYDINWKISSPLLKNIYETMRNKSKIGIFRFAHAETLVPFLSLLGLFKPSKPLRASNFDEERIFQASKIAPFSANALFLLYNCTKKKKSSSCTDGYHVKLFVNEKEERIANCTNQTTGLCSLTQFEEIFKDELTFDFDMACRRRPDESTFAIFFLIVSSHALVLFLIK